MWKGVTATATRQAWGLMIKFTGYIELKKLFARINGKNVDQLPSYQHALSGGLSNVVVGILNAPPDTIKTRLQDPNSPYKSTWDCVKTMVRTEGFKSLFKGAWVRVLRIAPGGALQFSAYEFFRREISGVWNGGG